MNLISKEGYKIGYDLGATHTPLDYLISSDPKRAVMPRGFRKLLVETCPMAAAQMRIGRVHGFRTVDIIEQDFNRNDRRW
jgi:hypothetical protein